MCAVFNETPTNYISVERLQNVEFDKIMSRFDSFFPKATEAVNSKMTSWPSSELIRYIDLMVFRVIWSEHSLIDKEQKGVGEFFYFKYFSRGGL